MNSKKISRFLKQLKLIKRHQFKVLRRSLGWDNCMEHIYYLLWNMNFVQVVFKVSGSLHYWVKCISYSLNDYLGLKVDTVNWLVSFDSAGNHLLPLMKTWSWPLHFFPLLSEIPLRNFFFFLSSDVLLSEDFFLKWCNYPGMDSLLEVIMHIIVRFVHGAEALPWMSVWGGGWQGTAKRISE